MENMNENNLASSKANDKYTVILYKKYIDRADIFSFDDEYKAKTFYNDLAYAFEYKQVLISDNTIINPEAYSSVELVVTND